MYFSIIPLLALTIFMEVGREIFFKLAANKSDDDLQNGRYLLKLLRSPLIWGGFACWGIEIICWIMVLSRTPLSVAFPVMSLCYCGVIIASKYVLHETVSKQKWLGVALVTLGVALIGLQEVS